MRRAPYARRTASWALWAVVLLPLWGCVSGPSSDDVLAVSFRSPEATFRSFQTALRGDLIDLEYRCLSSGFKRANRLSQQVYRRARAELLDRQPFFKLAARAEIVACERLSPERVRLTAHLEALWSERTFRVVLVREDFYETFDEGGLLEDGYAVWSDLLSRDGPALRLEVPMPEGVRLEELTEVRAGQEWKIDGFEALEPEA